MLTCFDLQRKAAINSMCKGTHYIELVCSCCGKCPLDNICHPMFQHNGLRLDLASSYFHELPSADGKMGYFSIQIGQA